MATYALIHGAYDVGWYWHLVERELQKRGHRSVAPDLPIEDDDATLLDNAQVVVDAINAAHEGGELIIVGQSWGGYLAPLVADLAKADRLVLVAPMIPQPGETNDEMWEATGWRYPQGEADAFYHDVDPALAAEAKSRSGGNPTRRVTSHGRSALGRTCLRTSSSVGTTGSSRPTGSGRSSAIGSASSPMSCRRATLRR